MTKNSVSLFLVAGLVTSTLGCSGIATIQPAFDLPSQKLRTEIPAGRTAVVFFNASNWITHGLDGSGKLNIFLSDKSLASLKIGEYVQVMLPPGEYIVTLAHWDIGTFISSHVLKVNRDRTFVKVYSKISSNGLEVLEAQPQDFEKGYKPALAK